MTNGEMIQALFPVGAVAVMSYPSNKVGFITRDGNPDDNYVWYPTSWWNAKYKAESESDVLDKIKAEIIENSIEDYKYHGCGSDELIIETSEVLEIIDKYKAKTEDK